MLLNQLNTNGFRTRRQCNFDITAVKRLFPDIQFVCDLHIYGAEERFELVFR